MRMVAVVVGGYFNHYFDCMFVLSRARVGNREQEADQNLFHTTALDFSISVMKCTFLTPL